MINAFLENAANNGQYVKRLNSEQNRESIEQNALRVPVTLHFSISKNIKNALVARNGSGWRPGIPAVCFNIRDLPPPLPPPEGDQNVCAYRCIARSQFSGYVAVEK